MKPLPPRLRDVVCMSASGLMDKEIAAREHIGIDTVETHWRRLRGRYGHASRPALILRALSEMRALHAPPPGLVSPNPPLFLTDRRAFRLLAPKTRIVDFDGLVYRDSIWIAGILDHDGVAFQGLGDDPGRTALRWETGRIGPFPFWYEGPSVGGDRPYGRPFDEGGGLRITFRQETVALGIEFSSLGTDRLPPGWGGPVGTAAAPDLWALSVRTASGWSSHHATSPHDGWGFAGFVAEEPIDEAVLRPGETCYPLVRAVHIG